ncbi:MULTISPECIES: translation initiation factor 2 [unclassified Streptomyces]|uniref:translation initiation factor 2 n=1 Tax=unclassified Streptomyces TaxID=2593676 RepID=UPI0029BBCDE0|nr:MULTISPECIES: translation initiation factor 2 [unclassified Streptomyces]MDX3771037.1 translation initiation factor 2 [Streptomyces sp. AK08-01B]MDX3820995.1 translation initiation factor 2 [Streptomyces sp. AK08-01A]
MTSRDRFTVVGRRTDCHVFEGDGTRPIAEENMRVRYVPESVKLPEEIAEWRREIEAEEAVKEAAGEPHRWNNPRFAVRRLVVTRTHTAEDPVTTLTLCDADYFDFLTTSINLDRKQPNGLTLRQQYMDGRDLFDAPEFMFCSFGINVALETGKDGKMLFSHRSARVVGPNTSKWNSSANEGLARNHDLSPDGRVSLHAVARRALREELAVLDSDDVDLELLGFGFDLRNNQWAAFFRAVVTDLSEDDLRERWSRGVEDKWEHDRHAFVSANPESVLRFMREEPEEKWTPCAPALFYLALVRGAVRAAGGNPDARYDVEVIERKVMRELDDNEDDVA